MIAGIIAPTGNLAAATPHQVIVQPIAGVAVTVGDIVMFDFPGNNTTYTDTATYDDLDNKKNPFNVVVLSTAALGEGGIYGVVTEAAAAGSRCRVCIAGMVTAKVTGTATIGATVLTPGAGVLVPAVTLVGTGVALALETNSSGPNLRRVLFNGLSFGSQGA
jgi:hypothetical protein